MNSFNAHISESAFLVNESRARNVSLSRDRFAHLWVNAATRELWEAFSSDVYPHDAIELGIRNRFFLTALESFVAEREHPVFVNIGAGFTSYPYLVDERCRTVEIDLAHVIEFKRQRADGWGREGRLPERRVEYIPADCTRSADVERLRETLERTIEDAPSFVLIEGLTYYLSRPALDALMRLCSSVQRERSLLAFDFWTPDTAHHPTFDRLRRFFSERFGHAETRYTLLMPKEIGAIGGYRLVRHTDVQELERTYLGTAVLADYDAILPEHYVLLERRM